MAGTGVQSVRYKGREYLRFPITPLVEMVYEYPERGTNEYLPREHIAETARLWDGTPLTFVHPENRKQTVRDPDAYAANVIGAVHNPEMVDGKLRVAGILDVKKAEDVGGHAAALVDDLRAGRTVQVSAGYGTVREDDGTQSGPGRFEGEQYDLTQGPPLPDHVAVFPNEADAIARCRPEDGCAAPRANGTANGTVNEHENETESTSMSETATESDTDEESDTSKAEQVAAMRQELAELRAILADLLNDAGAQSDQPQANAGACECERGQPHANYGAVAGSFERDLDAGRDRNREDAEEYPAGGRKAWERRQVGLDDVPDDSDEYPAGGRSNWKERKQRARTNAEQSAAETPESAAARRSASARQNGVEPSEWAAAEHPLLAKRKAEEREAKRKRQERLAEQSKSNYARHTDQ